MTEHNVEVYFLSCPTDHEKGGEVHEPSNSKEPIKQI